MARWREPSTEEQEDYRKWVAERPPAIRDIAEKFNPWTIYHLTREGAAPSRVVVVSFREAGHAHCAGHVAGGPAEPHCVHHDGPVVVVALLGYFNIVGFERHVLVDPARLVECELPRDDELVGSVDLSPEEIALPAPQRQAILSYRATLGNVMPFSEMKKKLPK